MTLNRYALAKRVLTLRVLNFGTWRYRVKVKIEPYFYIYFIITMVLYRAVRNSIDGTMESSVYTNLTDAYSVCRSVEDKEYCRRLLNGVYNEIVKGEKLIRVLCNEKSTYWIQLISDIKSPLPLFEGVKIDCCHCH
jgi:hypothetical protein